MKRLSITKCLYSVNSLNTINSQDQKKALDESSLRKEKELIM